MKAFKLSLKVVYYDRNMYHLYKNGMVVLTVFIYLATFEEACPHVVWSVPEAATTVLCTPDDGRDVSPKQVQ